MPLSRAAFTLVELLVAIGLAALPALARPLGAELDGTELLCELEAFGPTSVMPGIYKLDMDGTATRIVSYGRAPRWLPDRRRFWFIRPEGAQPAAQIALLDEHVTRPLSWQATSKMTWWPGKEGWVCVQSRGAGFPLLGAGPRLRSVAGEIQEGKEAPYNDADVLIRNVTFSSDGERMAFEALRYHTGAPIGEAHSLVAMDLRDGSRRSPDLSAFGRGYPMHPQWQPGGELVAFEFYQTSTRLRFVALWNLADDSVLRLVRDSPESCGLEAWSPDGTKLLVYQGDQVDGIGSSLWYFRADDWTGKHVLGAFERRLWSPCWNHDGTKIAYCVGQGDCLQCEPFGQVYVFDLATQETTKIELPANCRPVCLTW